MERVSLWGRRFRLPPYFVEQPSQLPNSPHQ